ncbi:MAG TPA: DMT family transporter [Usitatibacter sp.]|nr:DMT family transporter [Usitatibacter sp.]
MSASRTFLLTTLAMIAFASNSLLCRVALKDTAIDAATFTAVRIASGAAALWIIVRLRTSQAPGGSWWSAFWLFAYAAAFSFAYLALTAGTGALLLFGAVQATMIGQGLRRGERLGVIQSAGLAVAFAGLAALVAPGVTAPPLTSALLMLAAGFSWGVYSLRGRGAGDPTAVTAGNFLRAVPMALAVALAMLPWASIDGRGIAYAVASGAIASGMGYAIWYTALRGLKATTAASVQLSVPAIAAMGGVLFLGEALTLRLVLASVAILGGVAMAIRRPPSAA